jgi:hypothetical protein
MTQSFDTKVNVGRRAVIALAAGGIALATSAYLLIVAVSIPRTPEQKFEPGLNAWFMAQITLSLFGILAIATGIACFRMTRRVVLDQAGLTIHTFFSRRTVSWTDITQVARERRSMTFTSRPFEVLELLDRHGQRRAVIADTLADFETLAEAVVNKSSVTAGQPTYDSDRNESRTIEKSRRQIRWAAWGFACFAIAMAGGLVAGINEEMHVRRFPTEGVTVDATVVRTWMVRQIPHVEFSFTDAAGRTFTRDAMMYSGPDWEKARSSKTVPVMYLPSSPNWNRMERGEDIGPQFGGEFLFLTAGGVLMFGLLALVSFRGYDLKLEDGVMTLMRHGRVLRQWGSAGEQFIKRE